MRTALCLLGALVALAAGCASDESASLPTGAEHVDLDPTRFGATIDNPYWPMRPGSRWVYRETDADGNEQRIVVTVTGRTKRILGVDARVVHDVATEDGQVVEDTYDWYAQDEEGNVWYLGEDTKAYEDGGVSTEGSWEAGVDGAEAGVVVPAEPEPGLRYRQEHLQGEAEDAAEVLSVDGRARVPFGSFDRVLVTRETTPLEPGLVEHKSYAKGVGPVRAVTVAGGSDREVLVAFDVP
ncbi:MAG TPA: hypothetical protein VLB86_07785 [Gaiellaceae bacterium]|nr:hypothetical protein [Gaiellaceae bacterium]